MTNELDNRGATTPGTSPLTPELVGDKEAAAMLRLSVRTLQAWRTARPPKGPRSIKLGTAVRYRVADLRAYIEERIAAADLRRGGK